MMEHKIEAVLEAESAQVRLPDDLIDRIKLEAAKPVARRRPVLQWVAAAAAALVLAGVADWNLKTGAVAAALKYLGLAVQVQELNDTEVQEFQASHYDPAFDSRVPDEKGLYRNDAGTVSVRLSNTEVTLAEAQAAVAYQLVMPAALGQPEKVLLNEPGDLNGRVTLVYNQGNLRVSQQVLGEGELFQYNAPEGATEDVLVAGRPAVVIRGAWIMGDDGTLQWTPEFSAQLMFARDRQSFTIIGLPGDIPTEELVRIAESMQ